MASAGVEERLNSAIQKITASMQRFQQAQNKILQRGSGIDQSLVADSHQLDARFRQLQQRGAALSSTNPQVGADVTVMVQYVSDLEVFEGELSVLLAHLESVTHGMSRQGPSGMQPIVPPQGPSLVSRPPKSL